MPTHPPDDPKRIERQRREPDRPDDPATDHDKDRDSLARLRDHRDDLAAVADSDLPLSLWATRLLELLNENEYEHESDPAKRKGGGGEHT